MLFSQTIYFCYTYPMTSPDKPEMLEVIDGNDNVIGLEDRTKIHKEGLLHREIHVWFITPTGEVIFQHRSKDKDTYPDKLDATIGGHVEPGMSYEETALKEGEEETGIKLDPLKLKLIRKIHKQSFDEATNTTNNSMRCQYVYLFEGKIEDLHPENGKAVGFESWKIDSLPFLSKEDQDKFIPMNVSPEHLVVYEEGQKLLGLK